MSEFKRYTEQNRKAWNEIARIRARRAPTAKFFASGRVTLSDRDIEAAGDVRGKSLLHLQCATGEDTLSWAVLGAEVTGVDISSEQIVIAQIKANEARLPARFVAADIYDLPKDLQAENFDIVYTGGGALVWLPDIIVWAEIVARALRPGGCLLLHEEHPIAGCLGSEGGHVRINADYFQRRRAYEDQGWTHFQGGEDAKEKKYEFIFPLGDVVTSLVEAGMRILSLREFPAESNYRFDQEVTEVSQLPGSYLLVARKDL